MPALEQVLKWAEGRESREVSEQAITEAKATGAFIDLDVWVILRLGHAIWGFLNHCISVEARSVFDGAPTLNGFDGWRRVMGHITKNAWVRKQQLRDLVRHVPKIIKLEDIGPAVVSFDNNVRMYQEASGKTVDPDDKKSDLLHALPTEVREQLQWRMSLPESYEEFRNYLTTTANNMLFQRGRLPAPIQVVEGNQELQEKKK